MMKEEEADAGQRSAGVFGDELVTGEAAKGLRLVIRCGQGWWAWGACVERSGRFVSSWRWRWSWRICTAASW